MSLENIKIGNLSVSKMVVGGNPFSGFSHNGRENDLILMRYYTTDRIKETFKQAESLGVNTFVGRADNHIIRILLEYWDEGGTIQWIAQTTPELAAIARGVERAIDGGAKAVYLHGGQMDYLLANNKLDDVPSAIQQIKDAGLPAGVAGHNPEVHRWAEKNLDLDFYMGCYYFSAHRDQLAENQQGLDEQFLPEEREVMTDMIQGLSKPVIHYKVMAAGRNDPREAFAYVAKKLRPQDAVCVGLYTKDKPNMLAENLTLLTEGLQQAAS